MVRQLRQRVRNMNIFFPKNRIGESKAARRSARGFTLIEMIVSLSLFISVMTVAASSMLSIIDANRKSQATNTAVDNLNFVIDDMSRSLRTGKAWVVQDSGKRISFIPQGKTAANTTAYFLDSSKQIKMQVGSGPEQALTDPNLIVDSLTFFVDSGPNTQPFMHLLLKAHVSDKAKYRSDVNISTTISQRTLNR